jgi:hypothetical protein
LSSRLVNRFKLAKTKSNAGKEYSICQIAISDMACGVKTKTKADEVIKKTLNVTVSSFFAPSNITAERDIR